MELPLQADQHAQPPCSLNFFPLMHRKDLVHQAAQALDRLNGASADRYWISLCCSLGAELTSLGCPHERAGGEILAFQEAVLTALVAMNRDNRSSAIMQA